MDATIRVFGEILAGIYNLFKHVSFVALGVRITLWSLFLFTFVGGLVVWFLRKFLD